jgi:transcriptional regulator with XRE-family HTH domain
MEPDDLLHSAGKKLREIRSRLGLTIREVVEQSCKLVEEKGIEDYNISRSWLTDIENGCYRPASAFKLYALSVIYDYSWTDILMFFGLRISDLRKDQAMFGTRSTHLMGSTAKTDTESVTLPLRFREDLRLDKTNLLSRLVEVWGEIPIPLVQSLDLRKSMYGFIGLQDKTMFPILRPGSFVQIDGNQRKVVMGDWLSEYDRPIYFLELRDEYICSWCEVKEGQLLSIPHPLSRCPVRQFALPHGAEIVGRVTGVAMSLAEPMGA